MQPQVLAHDRRRHAELPRCGRANDLLPSQGDQPAGISVADLAVAIVDEIETPRHVQRRFTVAH